MIRSLKERIAQKVDDVAENLQNLADDLDTYSWESGSGRREGASTPSVTPGMQVGSTLNPADALRAVGDVLRVSVSEVSSGGRTSKATESTIDRMCREYGIEVAMPEPMGELRRATFDDDRQLVELAMVEEGVVGTPIYSGKIQKEPSGKYGAFTVRGSGGNAGLYEEYWASESQIYDAVQGHIDSLASGAWEIEMPTYVTPGKEQALRDFAAYHNAKLRSLQCMEGGFPTFIEHAATFIPIGFSLFEPVFAKDREGRWYLKKMGFREQSSVDEWHLNERGDRIKRVKFKTSGDNSKTYELNTSDNFLQNHLVWFGIGAYGSNFEGRPPTRPALHWVKMKRLIAQIVPLAAEKYGVPISYIKADPAYLALVAQGAGLNHPNLAEAYDKFKDARASEGPVFKFGDGVTAEIISPPNQMPGLDTWIQYCDQMISHSFSNEGNLLGMQSAVGSYAQAEVKERRFMRSAPGYARKITDSMNEKVYGPLARYQLGELIETPRLVFRPDALMEAGAWLTNARTLFGPNLPLNEWPERFQRIAHEKMGVPWERRKGEGDAD